MLCGFVATVVFAVVPHTVLTSQVFWLYKLQSVSFCQSCVVFSSGFASEAVVGDWVLGVTAAVDGAFDKLPDEKLLLGLGGKCIHSEFGLITDAGSAPPGRLVLEFCAQVVLASSIPTGMKHHKRFNRSNLELKIINKFCERMRFDSSPITQAKSLHSWSAR